MNVWRLIAHHEDPQAALETMKTSRRIAIGWSAIGDINKFKPVSSKEISAEVVRVRPDTKNQMMAGPSLWNLYAEMEIGDQVIVNAKGRRKCVFEVTGDYLYEKKDSILGYSHQRPAIETEIDPDELWMSADSSVSRGENVRWTLARCAHTKAAEDIAHVEGSRYSITSTAIERDAGARKKCLERYGYDCYVCGINFSAVYGKLGKDYIHVHHRIDLAKSRGQHKVDPVRDLLPLCPNCHAMVHKEKPAMDVDKLKRVYQRCKT